MPDAKPPAPADATKAERKSVVFVRRLSSTLALWVVVGGVMWWGNMWAFFVLLGALSLCGLVEFYRMLGDDVDRGTRGVTMVASVGYLAAACWFCWRFEHGDFFQIDVVAVTVLTTGLFAAVMRKPLEGRRTFDGVVEGLFGFVWMVLLFSFVMRLLFLPGVGDGGTVKGVGLLLYVVAVTKFTDMGAYAIGTWIGKHKMVPHISPGKTWQGFGGAILGASVASFGLLALMPGHLPGLTWTHAGVLAVLLGVVAVFGDLVESVVKRCLGTKDSGQLFPGIGGVMDLIDSLCFTAPVFYFYLRWLVATG